MEEQVQRNIEHNQNRSVVVFRATICTYQRASEKLQHLHVHTQQPTYRHMQYRRVRAVVACLCTTLLFFSSGDGGSSSAGYRDTHTPAEDANAEEYEGRTAAVARVA